ncbi:MAG: hypothetical protein FWF09_05130 [Bacteroidales bacterium]|nr:hypothetical protein [Bacteroidales bacterium]
MNMINDKWYDYFLELLAVRYPKKTDLAQALMDLLFIEREAAYRRLRKDVIFPAHEIIKIASEWNISLDEMIGINSGKISFHMQPMNYLDPDVEEVDILEKQIDGLEHLKTSPDSEYMVVFNNLSRSLSAGFENVYRFNVFKWAYQYHNDGSKMLFSEIVIPERVQREITRYYHLIKHVKNTSYILENMLFEYLVRDIQFFHSILLITDEEKNTLKKELHALLDYLLKVASTGCFPETGNKVQMYVSMINVNTNYSCFYTDKLKSFRIHAFNLCDIYTFHPGMIEHFKTWMHLKKRTSIQISEVDERSRIEFFTRQRQLVDSL